MANRTSRKNPRARATTKRRARRPAAATTKTTAKAAQTREAIYQAALALFQQHGYGETTMRAIAARAGTSLGLSYRYFASKDDIVLELYRRTAEEFERAAPSLAPGTVADRLAAALAVKIALCAPHRDVFAAVVPATLAPRSQAFALGADAADVRARIVRVYEHVIAGGSDADGLPSVPRAALLCFVLQLAVLYYWLHDDSAGQRRTHELVHLVKDSLHVGLGMFMLPEVDETVTRLVALLAPMFGPAATLAPR